MRTLKESLKCLALFWLCALLVAVTVAVRRVPGEINHQADATRAALQAELHIAVLDANQQLEAAITLLDRRTDSALREVHAANLNADQRTGEALGIVRILATNAEAQATGLRADVNGQLTTLNQTAALAVQPIGQLAERYTIPAREVQGLVAEMMGVLGATKITMGQTAVTAKVIAVEAPKMTAHVDSVASSVEREADQLTKPQTFWSSLRTWLLTLARIYGAI
jgi:hypothetical protein